MGRGGSGKIPSLMFEAFEEVASRNGDLTGTALEAVLPLELEREEELTLRALFNCSLSDPEALGFQPDTSDDEEAAEALVEKGLAEKNEDGWKLNKAGFQLAGQYLGTDFLG